jgi:outer membrane murein-binding lipoprotein Lpp
MLRKKWLLSAIVLSGLLLVGCASAVPTPTEEAMADNMSGDDESMSDDEMMDEGMSDDEEMADETMSDENMSDEEMMDDESMGDEEMMDDESMGDEEMMDHTHTFTVRIENLSTLLAPGVWAVHTEPGVLFTDGEADRGDGLEALAEDGSPSALDSALEGYMGVLDHGVFNTPVGMSESGTAAPGETYEFSFVASPGAYLSFATMSVQTNDLFYAPDGAGIPLFDADLRAVRGDITDQISLWDAGTEVNQAPGEGADQGARQAAANTGADEGGVVQLVDDGFTYPDTTDAIRVTITIDEE